MAVCQRMPAQNRHLHKIKSFQSESSAHTIYSKSIAIGPLFFRSHLSKNVNFNIFLGVIFIANYSLIGVQISLLIRLPIVDNDNTPIIAQTSVSLDSFTISGEDYG